MLIARTDALAIEGIGGAIARAHAYAEAGADVIIPSDLQRAAIHAMGEVLRVIARDGNSAALLDRMASFKEREAIVGTDGYLERGRRYDVGATI